MILSAPAIKRHIRLRDIYISGYREDLLGPNSYNLTLGSKLKVYDLPLSIPDKVYHPASKKIERISERFLDPKKVNPTVELQIPVEGLVLRPGILYLAHTAEYTETRNLVPMLEGRSSIARLGIFVHATAGFGDIGFAGEWTLEISVVQPVKIYAGMEICQIYWIKAAKPWFSRFVNYSGKYQGSLGVEASKMYLDRSI